MFNPEELAYTEPAKRKFKLPRLKKPSLPAKPSKKTGIILSALLVVGLMVGGWFSYQNLKKQFQPPPTEAVKNDLPPQEVLGLIESVENTGADLPDNEFPSVATINDLEKLSDQAFFNGAQVGDKVLIYADARRAILYRPTTKKIIRASRVEITDSPNAPASSSAVLSASDSAEPVLRITF